MIFLFLRPLEAVAIEHDAVANFVIKLLDKLLLEYLTCDGVIQVDTFLA